jgi:uncharacterized protein YchJ
MLVKLKDRFAPTSRARLEEWRLEWAKASKTQKGVDMEEWLLKWETLYSLGRTLNAPEVIDPHDAIYYFLKAIGPCEFRGPWTAKLNKGTKSYEFEEVVRTYRVNQRQAKYDQKPRGEHGVFATQEGENEAPATLQGRTNSPQQGPQQGQGGGRRKKEARTDCPCGTIHKWRDCLYVMKTKRTKSWRPNKDIEAKVDAYICEKPGFQYVIQKAEEQEKARTAQPRTSDLPVSFATAFQVSQGLTLSTYELARSTILDSGATIHVCNDRTRFYNLKEAGENSYSSQETRGFRLKDLAQWISKCKLERTPSPYEPLRFKIQLLCHPSTPQLPP